MSHCPRCQGELDLVLQSTNPHGTELVRDFWCPQCHGTLTEVFNGEILYQHWLDSL